MNARSYKTVFSKRLGTLVAVGEHASSQGKANGAGSGGGAGASGTLGYIAALTASFALVSLAWAAPANNALPTAGQVVQGSANMSQAANQLTINQGTQRAAINWQSFNIGAAAKVQVVQPNAQAVLLNRVVGQSPSQIFGQLSANGHVILVNPNGVLFGKDGSVNAGGFTASTLNISDANFMAGNMVYERNGSTAGIVNEGSITTAPGGYVALLGATVSNEGSIKTQGGSVVMGAGETIKVPVSGTGRIKLELTPAAINASVSNSGSIVTEGGQVYIQALALNRAAAQILQSGSIDTTGEKGGDVHLLADGGVIKVDGSITADSTIAGNKGGDIVIGRDEITGVLARATDVSGAKLESLGGFVETSGDYLKTDGISVKAKDWLLDPTDIKIVSADNALLPNTATVPGSGLFQDTTAVATSEVLKSTIETAINNGTNVTISTANPLGSGEGNITIETALSFNNNGPQDATLTLLAKNGITQNVNASITTATTSSKLVNVLMAAEGLPGGVSGTSANSKGITLQAAITTNGDVTLNGTTNNSGAASASNAIGVDIRSAAAITAQNISITGKSESSFGIQSASVLKATNTVTLEGTSKNWVGVTTTGAITATNGLLSIKGTKGTATDASGYQGININSNLTGASVSLIGTSYGHYGVQVQNVTVKSTSGDVYIEGTGSNTAITTGQNESSGTRIAGIVDAKAKATIKGTTSDAGLYQGLIISNQIKGASVEITGIAANHIGAAVNNGAKVTASAGDVIINGTSNTNEGLGVGSQSTNGGATITATGSVTLTGTSNSSLIKSGTAGVRFWGSNSVTASNAINITGIVDTLANKSGVGVEFQRYPSATSLKTTNGDINITGTLTGNGGGSGVRMGESGWGAQAPMISAGGNFTLRGNNRGSNSNASPAISASGGMQVSAGGNIVVQAETNNAAVAAMSFYSGTALKFGVPDWGSALQANTSFITSKNVLIQANQGGIVFNNSITQTLTSGVAPNVLTALTDIQGKNITIDNTGAGMVTGPTNIVGAGSIDAATGAIITAGSGGATGGTSGINMDGRKLTATGNLNIMGVAIGTGSGIGSNAVLTADGAVNLTGKSVGGTGLISAGAVKSNNDAVSIIGNSTGSTGGSGSDIQGMVTANSNINLEGYSGNINNVQGLLVRNTVNSTGGDITVKGETKAASQRAVAITANGANNGSLKVADGKNININANSLLINNVASTFVDAGPTGTVNIKTTTAGNEIKIGFPDGPNATLGSQVLGIDNGELSLIKAGNLVIGDTASNGKITVAGATTTAAATGNITLKTGGDIAINEKLEVNAAKTLTLSAGGAVSDDNTKGIIKASQLQLLGVNASVTLDSKKHEVGTLAADVKSLEFKNGTAVTVLTVGSVNNTTGIQAKEGVIVTTETGNLNLNEAISNTSSGNIVVGAGVSKLATETSGGDVQTATGKSISNTNGKTFVYSGSAASTGALGNLDSTLGALKIDGTTAQNADTNAAFGAGAGISGSSAKAQAIFREKLSFANGTLSDATLTKVYGDDNTKNTAAAALLAEAKGALKNDAANSGTNSTVTTGAVGTKNRIEVSKSAVADTLTSTLTGGQFSTSQFLKAQTGTYKFNGMTSTKYDVGTGIDVAVNVDKLALTGSIAQSTTTYGDALAAGTVNLTNTVGSDVVSANGVTFTTTGKTSTSGNLKAGTHADVQSVTALSGTDKDNYTFADVKGSYKVEQKALSGSIAQSTTTYGDTLAAGAVTLTNKVGTDVVAADGVTFTTTGKTSTSGNLKAGTHADVQSVAALSGTDKDNYTFANVKGSYKVEQKALTGTIVQGNTTYGDALTAGTVNLTNTVGSDVVSANGVTFTTTGKTSTSGNLKAGTHADVQSVTDLTGADKDNYTFANVKGSYRVDQRPLTIAAGSVADKTADGTTAATVTPGALSNLVGNETLGVAATGTFSDANAGNKKAVNAFYTLQNGANGGEVSNYVLALGKPGNPDTRMTGNILASVNPVINPTPSPVNNNTGSRVSTVSGFSGSGAATGVLDDKPVTESREVCSDVFPENCECQPSVIPSIEICFAPKRVAVTKEEK